MIDIDLRNKLRREAQLLNPVAWIGKNGFSETVKIEIKKQLKNKKLIKVKVLKSFIDENEINKKDFAEEIAKEIGCELVQKIGFMVVLYKPYDRSKISYNGRLNKKIVK